MKKSLAHRILNKLSRQYLMSRYSIWPQYVVTEYPKSGGSWLSGMLSKYLAVPFPRNKIPGFCQNIMHGHFLDCPNAYKTIHILRDGRDVMISFYYHCLFVNELFNERLVNQLSPRFNFPDKTDIENNLPIYMEDIFKNKIPFGFSWPDFIGNWNSKNVSTVKYESLLTDSQEEMRSLIAQLLNQELDDNSYQRLSAITEEFSFNNQKQQQGNNESEVSFLRSGRSGQWKTIFNEESKQVFKHYAGNCLIELGYEKNNDW